MRARHLSAPSGTLTMQKSRTRRRFLGHRSRPGLRWPPTAAMGPPVIPQRPTRPGAAAPSPRIHAASAAPPSAHETAAPARRRSRQHGERLHRSSLGSPSAVNPAFSYAQRAPGLASLRLQWVAHVQPAPGVPGLMGVSHSPVSSPAPRRRSAPGPRARRRPRRLRRRPAPVRPAAPRAAPLPTPAPRRRPRQGGGPRSVCGGNTVYCAALLLTKSWEAWRACVAVGSGARQMSCRGSPVAAAPPLPEIVGPSLAALR